MNKITSIYTQEEENSEVIENFSTISHFSEIETSSMSTSSPRLVTPVETGAKPLEEKASEEESLPEYDKMKVGERLRYTREKKNLSIQHIADRLYLSPSVIGALEADDYENLPSAVFVRGYLRNYAKLLEISTESIIEGYEQQLGHQLPSAIVPAGESPAQPQQAQATSNHFWVKTMTFTVITVLMVLAAVTIVSQNLFSKRTDTPTTTLQIPLQSPPTSSETLPEEPVTPPLVPLPHSTGPANPTGAEATATVAPVVTPSNPTTETAPPPTTETMTVYLKQKSWLEVTDSTNKKLYNSIANANSDFTITGIPPFKVKVGNIDGVNIEYRGEKNPITSYSKQQNTNRTYLVGDKVPTNAPE